MMVLVPAALGALLTGLLIVLFMRSQLGKRFIDTPNDRSLHQVPTPRIGGLAIFAATVLLCLGFAALADITIGSEFASLWGAFAVLAVLGMVDDRISLGAAVRGVAHLLVAIIFIFVVWRSAQFSLATSILLALIAVLAMSWSANLFNFMDGSDGLVGLSAAIGLSTLAWLAPSESLMSLTCATLAGSCAGFLLFNWQPAKIFLGDAGSVPIGFAAAALGVLGVIE